LSHKKDIQLLEERLSRVDGLLQMSIKEKSSLASQAVAREKEITELVHKQTMLRANVCSYGPRHDATL
jgi:hypothetical protein